MFPFWRSLLQEGFHSLVFVVLLTRNVMINCDSIISNQIKSLQKLCKKSAHWCKQCVEEATLVLDTLGKWQVLSYQMGQLWHSCAFVAIKRKIAPFVTDCFANAVASCDMDAIFSPILSASTTTSFIGSTRLTSPASDYSIQCALLKQEQTTMRLAWQTEALWTGEDFLMDLFTTCEYSYYTCTGKWILVLVVHEKMYSIPSKRAKYNFILQSNLFWKDIQTKFLRCNKSV